MMNNNGEFEQLLKNLQSIDNEIRSSAEANYERINANTRFNMLMQVISDKNQDVENRKFSGVLCRRLLDVNYEEAFECMDKSSQETIQHQFLQLIVNEDNTIIRKRLTDITAEVAKRQFDDEGNFLWHGLLDFVFNICISNANEELKVTGLNIFIILPNILSANTQENLNIIGTTLSKCLSTTNESGVKQSIQVRDVAVRALCSFVISEYDENQQIINQLRSLIPHVLQTVHDSIQENPFEDAVMKSFIELVDDAPGFLKANVQAILQLCISILQTADIDDMQKHLAIEAFASLSESCTNAVRKCHDLARTIIQYLFNMLTDIEDIDNWAQIDEEEIEDDSSNNVIAEISLDRIAVAMKGKRLLEEIKQTVPNMLRNSNWKHRHGGLKAISSMGEGLQKVMNEILGSIVDEVVRLLSDEHPRVRFAACVCIGQMSTDFEPSLQSVYHDKIMPGLLIVLQDSNNPRVQAYACSALTNFCEGASKDDLQHYLPVLMDKLLHVLKSQCDVLVKEHKKLVLEQVVTTIAAVSDTAGNKFHAYYPAAMPIMKWLMQNCNTKELRLLRGKSIECISLMGLAVGKDKFLSDAQDVMNILMHTQTQETEITPDDPQHSYMISAWARICKMLGREFAPYLQYVMPPVMKTANMKPETCFMYDEETEDVDKDWQVVRVGQDQNVAINTSGIDDKINACQMLICYARELKEEFAPYVRKVTDIMLPLLKFYLNDDVRSAAADIIPYLIDSSKPLGEEVRRQLWDEMLSGLLGALQSEEERIQQADMLGAIADGIEKMGSCQLPEERLQNLCELVKTHFETLFLNVEARAAKKRADDYDDEEDDTLETEKDDDDNVLAKLVGVVHSLFRVYGQAALPLFQQLNCYVWRLLETGRPSSELQYGLCFLDTLLEFVGGSTAFDVVSRVLPVFRGALRHMAPEVRQAAAYGYGLMAQYGGPSFNAELTEATALLVEMISAAESRSVDNNLATENAISALTKMAQHQPHCLQGPLAAQFVPAFLSWLPVYEDLEEAPVVYSYLCDLLEQNNQHVTQQHNLIGVIKAIASVINKEALPADHAVYKRCLTIVNLLQQANEVLFNQCIQNLSDDEKISLNDAIIKARA